MTDDDDWLEAHFDAARRAPGPSEDLVARVLAGAETVQAAPVSPPARAAPGIGARIAGALGGWLTVSGLAAACAAGVAIGVQLPETLDTATGGGVSALFGDAPVIGFTGIEAVGLAGGIEGLQ
ncbi:hypothetical protein HKCCE2091_14555 [Rhodobacterales bacterium HKCCE2091]|nr:hypothetical protein [Rhodobacterales bacterium HKCCE2091]